MKRFEFEAGADGARAGRIVKAFAASSIDYRVRFWIEDCERDEEARDEVRAAIYYAFRRHGIEIPYPDSGSVRP